MFHPVFVMEGKCMHPVVKVLWMIGVGIILGSIFVFNCISIFILTGIFRLY